MRRSGFRPPRYSLTRRLRPLAYALGAIVAFIVLLTWLALQSQIALASFLNADTAWLTAQSRATVNLLNYVNTGNGADYAKFQRDFATLDAFRRARDRVLSGRFDYASVERVLSQGNAEMVAPRNAIFMFDHFSGAPYIKDAVALWKATDAPIDELQAVAEVTREAYANGTPSDADVRRQRSRITAIDDTVTRTNPRFSMAVTQGAVAAGTVMFLAILLLAAVAIVLWLVMARRVLVGLHGSEEQYRLLFDSAPDAIIIRDGRSGRVLDGNRTARAWSGWEPQELVGVTYAEWFARCGLREAAPGSAAAGRADEQLRPVETRNASLLLGRQVVRQTIVHDVSERVNNERHLADLATHDPLTRLINRTEFQQRCNAAVRQAARDGGHVAVLFIDMDGFKAVNDRHGHAVGDGLLKLVGERMSHQLRDGDAAGRVGGDEFAVLLTGLAGRGDAVGLAERMLAVLSAPFEVDGRDAILSASIGIAGFPGDGDDARALISNADMAMYTAKRSRRGTWRLYDASMRVGTGPVCNDTDQLT